MPLLDLAPNPNSPCVPSVLLPEQGGQLPAAHVGLASLLATCRQVKPMEALAGVAGREAGCFQQWQNCNFYRASPPSWSQLPGDRGHTILLPFPHRPTHTESVLWGGRLGTHHPRFLTLRAGSGHGQGHVCVATFLLSVLLLPGCSVPGTSARASVQGNVTCHDLLAFRV